MAKRALVVDDKELLRELCQDVLQYDGYEVVTCENGETALAAYQGQGSFNIVVTDVDMGPGMNGIELARRILEIKADQPIVVMSGENGAALRQAEVSGIPTLRKPFEIADLSDLVRLHALCQ